MSEDAGSAPSLRRQLLWLVLAAIALVSVLQAGSAYRSALREADGLFDEHLRELARSVSQGASPQAFDLQVQIWGPDGVQVFRSPKPLPSQVLLGFSDVEVEGTHYRVYALQTPQQTIQVAQDRDARESRARGLALRAIAPVALLAPLLMAAVWFLITRSLAPVERMRRQVAARPAEDLSALPETGLPEEVLPLVQELNLLFDRVRLAFDAQRHFVADAAHELRSPLAALKLQAQALHRADDTSREAALRRLEAGIERAIRLVSQMLLLARAESDAATAPQPVDLQQLARDAVAEVLPQARERGIDLGLEDGPAATVQGQPEPLQLLLRNLLENAVKYTPEGGRVDISIERDAAGASLLVEDSGPGIPDADRERVFDRFYRTPDAAAPGSGLGLAIVRTIATRHGATVALDRSARLGGLRVRVRFPA
jgi:two-component system OmpR family sensor kinase